MKVFIYMTVMTGSILLQQVVISYVTTFKDLLAKYIKKKKKTKVIILINQFSNIEMGGRVNWGLHKLIFWHTLMPRV